MRALLTLVVAFVFAGIVLAQSPVSKTEPTCIDLLQWLENADVKGDFHRNVEEKRDTRFIAVNGLASNMVLGASRPLVDTHGFWLIEGTSDFECGPLGRKAVEYARHYNMMLEKYLESQPAH